jgi:hypothetical protein
MIFAPDHKTVPSLGASPAPMLDASGNAWAGRDSRSYRSADMTSSRINYQFNGMIISVNVERRS